MSSKAGGSQIPQLLRSTSVPDVVPRSSGADESIVNKSLDTAEINAQPQDFVVVGGAKFRVTRSPRVSSDPVSPITRKVEDISPVGSEEIPDDPVLLRKALQNANEIIASQNGTIRQQAILIERLENELKEAKESAPTLPKDTFDSRVESSVSTSVSRISSSRFSARRRAEAKEIRDKSVEGTPASDSETVTDGSTVGRPSSIITSPNASPMKDADLDTTWNRLETSSVATLTPNISPLGGTTASPLPDISGTTATPTSDSPKSGEIITMSVSGCASPGASAGPPKGLAARLAMGSQERRKLAAAKKTGGASTSSTTPGLIPRPVQRTPKAAAAAAAAAAAGTPVADIPGGVSTPAIVPPRAAEPVFFWKEEKARNNKQFLFVAYDNPQVSTTIATRISSEKSMHVMLECKDDNNGQACFVLGEIVYSGDIEGVEGADLVNPRGAQFLVITDIKGIRGDLQQFPSRVMGDISEIDLDGCKLPGFVGGGGLHNRVDVSDDDKLAAFLQLSSARVDVILDPSHSNMWYPYWEGKRKMAPQFRSKGVGYVRLGDDMSRFGTAFISLDAGQTYLDKGATSIVAGASPTTSAPAAKPTAPSRQHDSINSPSRSKAGTANRGLAGGDSEKVSTGGAAAVAGGGSTGSKSGPGSRYDTPTRSTTSSTGASTQVDEIATTTSVAARVAALSRLSSARKVAASRETASAGAGAASSTTPRAITRKPSWHVDNPSAASSSNTARRESVSVNREFEEMKAAVTSLKDTEPNWAGRVELIRRLYTAICNVTSVMDSVGFSGSNGTKSDATSVVSGITPPTACNVEFPTSLITEIVGVLINCITRQKNPHVLRAAVCCVRVIAPHAAVATPVGIAWRTLLIETIHLLRVISKPVFEEARDALLCIHGTAISLATLYPLADEILAGPNGKTAGASNTSRVVQWFDAIVKSESAATVAVMSGSGKMAFDRVDCGTLFNKCRPLLKHREETTRDVAVDLCGSLLAHDILCGSIGGYEGFCSLVVNVSAAAELTEAPTKSTENTIGIEAPITPRKLVNNSPFSKSFRALEFVGPDATADTSGALLATLKRHGSASASKRAFSQYSTSAAGSAGGAGGHLLAALSASFVKGLSELEETNLRVYEKVMLAATQVLVALLETEEKRLSELDVIAENKPNRLVNAPFPDMDEVVAGATAMDGVGDGNGSDLYGDYADDGGDVPEERLGDAVSSGVSNSGKDPVVVLPLESALKQPSPMSPTTSSEDAAQSRTPASSSKSVRIFVDGDPPPVATELEGETAVAQPDTTTAAAAVSDEDGNESQELQAARSDATAPMLDTVVHSEEIVNEAMSHLSLTGDKVKELLERLKAEGGVTSDDLNTGTQEDKGGREESEPTNGTSASLAVTESKEPRPSRSAAEESETKNISINIQTPDVPPNVPLGSAVASPPPAPVPVSEPLPQTPERFDKSEASTPAVSAMNTPNSKAGGGTAPTTPQSKTKGKRDKADISSLSPQWFEARLILRIIPNTDAGWLQFSTVVQGAPYFFSGLDDASAKSGLARGALIRKLLPFDEETSSSDQSQVRKGGNAAAAAPTTPPRSPIRPAGAAPSKVEVDPDLVGAVKDVEPETLMQLRAQAVGIRRMVRVKMADEADLKQAIQATTMLKKFCDDAETVAHRLDIPPANVVLQLEEEGTPKKASFCGGLFMRRKK